MNLQQVLDQLKIKSLNPMQEAAIAAAGSGSDLILLSPTGSGKTLAFLLPVLSQLKAEHKGIQCLILVPSRELALQIAQVFRQMSTGFKVTCSYGGHSVRTEKNDLLEAPAVLIGTPGRIAFHLRHQHFDESTITNLVLDEFDKALEFGFEQDMSFIISSLRSLKQKMLTSATAMADIPEFTRLSHTAEVNFLKEEQVIPGLQLKKIEAAAEDKLEALFNLICKIGDHNMLIFCNHRETVDRISDLLIDKDLIHDIFHGGMDQDERERALLKFRNGSIKILITTDLAARGLDIPEVEYIIHYQLPYTAAAFLHRNGRTARMNSSGTVYLLMTADEKYPFLKDEIETEDLKDEYPLPPDSLWQTLYISAGKKDKVNKIDIVGLLIKKGGLEKNDVGLIEVKDQASYVAIKRRSVSKVIAKLVNEKIKNKKVKIETAL